ncbi:MAG: LysR family transcriptional regulator [Anaerolineae bacterium]|nr:LysR family transcriptional regulator [Anaerolineae bacterium]
MLSLYKLEVFSAVVESGSFSGAADRLYLTQPAVSQHIQDLEARLGVKLFKRGRRGVSLTAAGETLRDYTSCILRLVAEAESAVTNVEQLSGGQIRIGATPGAGMYLLPDWMRAFQRRFPNLAISLTTDVTAQVIAGILNHTLDMGFIEGEPDNNGRLAQLVLQEVSQYVIVGQGHDWCGRETIAIHDLNGQPFITRTRNSQTRAWLDQLMNEYGVTVNVVAEFDNPEAIKQAVISGMGLAIMPEYVVRRERDLRLLRAVPVADAALVRTLKLVWDGQSPFKPAARAFLTHLSSQFPQVLSLPQYKSIAGTLTVKAPTCIRPLDAVDD